MNKKISIKNLIFITIVNVLFFVLSITVKADSSDVTNSIHSIKKISMVSSKGTKDSYHGRLLNLIYTEAFKRLGIELEYEGYIAKRASWMSDSGMVDGELHRIRHYSDKHPNLIRVEEPYFSIYLAAYGVDPTIRLNDWKSLQGTQYTVGHRKGVKICETELPKYLEINKIMTPISIKQGLRQVINKRADLFIDVQAITEDMIKSDDELKDSNIQRVGIMEEISTHSFLHKKHRSLAPKVSTVLKDMKKEGLIEKFKKMAEIE